MSALPFSYLAASQSLPSLHIGVYIPISLKSVCSCREETLVFQRLTGLEALQELKRVSSRAGARVADSRVYTPVCVCLWQQGGLGCVVTLPENSEFLTACSSVSYMRKKSNYSNPEGRLRRCVFYPFGQAKSNGVYLSSVDF